MDEPTCRRCQTADYLRIQEYRPSETHQLRIPTSSRTIHKTRVQAAEVSFYCAKCGAFDGHSVPDDWECQDGRISNEQILDSFGAVWRSPTQMVERTTGGTYKVVTRGS